MINFWLQDVKKDELKEMKDVIIPDLFREKDVISIFRGRTFNNKSSSKLQVFKVCLIESAVSGQ